MGLFGFLGKGKLTLKDIDELSRNLDILVNDIYLPSDPKAKQWKEVGAAKGFVEFKTLANSKFLVPLNGIYEKHAEIVDLRKGFHHLKDILNIPLATLIINWKKYERRMPHQLMLDIQQFLVDDKKDVEEVVSGILAYKNDVNVCIGHLEQNLGKKNEAKDLFEVSERLVRLAPDFLKKHKKFIDELTKKYRVRPIPEE